MITNEDKQMDDLLNEIKHMILGAKQALYNRMEDGDYEDGASEDQFIMLGQFMSMEDVLKHIKSINDGYELEDE